MRTTTDTTTTLTQTTSNPVAPDFAQVYGDHLTAVHRFVRARVPDHAEADDVTSDVFVRAWRAWDRFDPSRGPVEPWLFTIAARTVADWWRGRRPEPVDVTGQVTLAADHDAGPEPQALREELLVALGAALGDLSDREREGLALRFAARLSSHHIAQVLGTSPDAAKQMLHRAIVKLRDLAVPGLGTLGSPADLEAVVDDVVARGHRAMHDSELHALLVHAMALHETEVPDDLSSRVADCIACDERPEGATRGTAAATTADAGSRRGMFAGGLAGLVMYGPVCLACGMPWAAAVLGMLGFGSATFWIHEVALVTAPVITFLAWRGYRRHRRAVGFRIALVGAVILLFHAALHLGLRLGSSVHPADLGSAPRFLFDLGTSSWFGTTNAIGGALVVVGALVHLALMRTWRTQQLGGVQPYLAIPTA